MRAEIADALEVALGWWLVSAGAVVQAASLLLIAIVLVAVPSAVKRLRIAGRGCWWGRPP